MIDRLHHEYRYLDHHVKILTILGLAVLILLTLFLFPGHAPLSDDLSMIAFSKAWSVDWFNKGLADYFIVYPEYYGPQSNFVRPVSNFAYWLFGTLLPFDAPFFANRIQLIVLNFGMPVCIAIGLYAIAVRGAAHRIHALFVMISALLLPPYWMTPTPTYTSFVFDGLSVAFCLFAMIAFDKKRIVLMTIFLTLALLTKEIALPIVGAFAITFLIRWNLRAVMGSFIAIAIWGLMRFYAFGFDPAGVYVFESGDKSFFVILSAKLRNIFTLPFGPVLYETIFTEQGVNLANRSGILLLVNLGFYVTLAYVAIKALGRFRNRDLIALQSERDLDRNDLSHIVTLTVLFSYLFDAYIGANYRYAFNLLPFLFLLMAWSPLSRHAKTVLFAAIVIASGIASQPAFARLSEGLRFETFRYAVIRDLFEVLRVHQGQKPLVITNDFVLGYANPKAIEILAPTQTSIIRGTSLYLDGCSDRDLEKIQTTVTRNATEIAISTTLPECGRFTFESAPKLTNFASGNTINRNSTIAYRFRPDPNSTYSAIPGWTGRDLTMISRESDILYFDFSRKSWVFISAEN